LLHFLWEIIMRNDLTFWGHNCFLIESEAEALLIDPWLDADGAFYGGWHQWPPNSHLRDTVRQRCVGKSLKIFITHEHQDHFDISTLRAFENHPDCTVLIPAYREKFLFDALQGMNLRTTELTESDVVGTSIQLRIFIDDGGLNHDSAIFVKTEDFTFFNQNDCKIFDQLPMLKKELGDIDYYSVQFSGANWYPACFDMPDTQRRSLAKQRSLNKLHNVFGGIKALAPRFYVPAAGPAFFPFLDPSLNTGTGTIFIHQDELASYLAKKGIVNILYPRPGERIDEHTDRTPIAGPTLDEIAQFRASHTDVWAELADNFSKEVFAQVLQRRLDALAATVVPPETPSISFSWGPNEGDCLTVDLVAKKLLDSRQAQQPCLVLTASTKYFSLMCGDDRWQDIALSLQAQVQRLPDVYNTIANIFLFANEDDLAESIERSLNLSTESIVIEHMGQKYEINRYCPHQGGDLAYAVIDEQMNVVCPRHSWKFDLTCGGVCKSSGMSINAVKLS
jgi:UDP-MurNAc hydroxylase